MPAPIPALLLALLAVSGCAGRDLGDLPAPLVDLRQFDLDGSGARLLVSVRNYDRKADTLAALRAELVLDGTVLSLGGDGPLPIPAQGTEAMELRIPVPEALRARLESAGANDFWNYRLRGEVRFERGGGLRFDVPGRLDPVPGRAGSFR